MYKPGDKVRIVSDWGSGYRHNLQGGMDCWLGTVMTVEKVIEDVGCYHMKEDHHSWYWYPEMIAGPFTQQLLLAPDIMAIFVEKGAIKKVAGPPFIFFLESPYQ